MTEPTRRKKVGYRSGLPGQWFRNLGGFPTKRDADPGRGRPPVNFSNSRHIRRELGLSAGKPLSGRQWTRQRKALAWAERA